MYFSVIRTTSLRKCLFRSSANIETGFFIFLLLTFKSSLCILDNCPLLDVSYANTLSVACLLILLTVSFSEQKVLS